MDADLLSATLADLNRLLGTATSEAEREHLASLAALLKDPDGHAVQVIADRVWVLGGSPPPHPPPRRPDGRRG